VGNGSFAVPIPGNILGCGIDSVSPNHILSLVAWLATKV
jgi:hypothetical protein